ncbi:MAG: sigma-54 dependent transcriptional regulator [Betaproteobacteria bacterium]|nr:sigma-54 dependent transcriptional regulator [Betaproteobacteria bacterium]MDH5220454.1 sigma-54 dependent transcriptional regulator [Betaproteobacteria bacterium]MDH5349545.1 sigma-54 dependent transcriptional regulator [Betaproteobacteria bacterium]
MSRRPAARDRMVLVVDDEPDIRELLELTLTKMGLGVAAVGTLAEARERLRAGRFELCLTDMRLPDGEGLELVRHIAAQGTDLPVAVITAYGSAENAVAALKAGAFDYVSKPVGLEQLRALVKSALSLPDQASAPARDSPLLGESAPLVQARELIAKLARTQAPVHVCGESGSGKELAARLIHGQGARRDRPFVPVNCGAIPESLVESEFFGYRKGAFTGADQDRDGFFQAANGGTLFLDEVADLPLGMQVKLLRAIQEKRVRKVGATQEEPVDVRIVSATHQNLARLVEAGRFRQDLYYRLNVIELKMPPLRECREDIAQIAGSILARIAQTAGTAPAHLSAAALAELSNYDFPGNIRELENVLERATALSAGGEISPDDLMLRPAPAEEAGARGAEGALDVPLPDYLDRVEREAILGALARTQFNRTAAAKLLGITFRTLRYRMQRLGIKEG